MLDDEDLGTKVIENLLASEIHNWLRWARQRNYLPASVKCVLGNLAVQTEDDLAEAMKVESPLPPVESEAEAFEAVIVGLPERLRQAFILHHLDRGRVGSITVRVKGRNDKARVLGVGSRQYHYMVKQAHSLVLRRWTVADQIDD